ncbi:DUF397 domain-containing protein [Actinomadura nitritigenes]|uniref:DUF397 domain-containing protein n=1 Tax=Actinomadura nitritigenes TaxID=134602 RepID=UPI003D91F23A
MRMSATSEGKNRKMESLKFRKSTRCQELNQTGCIEVAKGLEVMAVRDSTNQKGPVLLILNSEWRALVRTIQGR